MFQLRWYYQNFVKFEHYVDIQNVSYICLNGVNIGRVTSYFYEKTPTFFDKLWNGILFCDSPLVRVAF